jgi:hypothetical protein
MIAWQYRPIPKYACLGSDGDEIGYVEQVDLSPHGFPESIPQVSWVAVYKGLNQRRWRTREEAMEAVERAAKGLKPRTLWRESLAVAGTPVQERSNG